MKILEIKIAGLRCFADPVTIGPLDDRISVLAAPNGAGKSSVRDALTMLIFDSHTSDTKAIRARVPWGRQLSPRVEVAYEHDGAIWRLRKQFLKDRAATLVKETPHGATVVAEGLEAHDKLRNLLRGQAPAGGRRGAAGAQTGLAQVLWTSDLGSLALNGLPKELTALLHQHLDARQGRDNNDSGRSPGAANAHVSDLEQRIDRHYARHWTGTGLPLKQGAVRTLERERERLAAELARVTTQLDEMGPLRDELERLEARRVQVGTEREAQRAQVDSLDARARHAQRLDTLVAESQIARDRADGKLAMHAEQERRRAHHAQQVATLGKRIRGAEADLDTACARREVAGVEEATARAARTRVDEQSAAIRRNAAALADAETLLAADAVVDTREALLRDLARESVARDRLVDQIDELGAPGSAALLNAIRQTASDIRDAKKDLERALITVQITPVRAATIRVLSGVDPADPDLGEPLPTAPTVARDPGASQRPAPPSSRGSADLFAPLPLPELSTGEEGEADGRKHGADNDASGEPDALRTPARSTWVVHGGPDVRLDWKGVGVIRVLGGADTIEATRERLAMLSERLRAACKPFGTLVVGALEQRFEHRRGLEQSLAEVNRKLAAVAREAQGHMADHWADHSAEDGAEDGPGSAEPDVVRAALEQAPAEAVPGGGPLGVRRSVIARYPEWEESRPDVGGLRERNEQAAQTNHADTLATAQLLSAAEADAGKAEDAVRGINEKLALWREERTKESAWLDHEITTAAPASDGGEAAEARFDAGYWQTKLDNADAALVKLRAERRALGAEPATSLARAKRTLEDIDQRERELDNGKVRMAAQLEAQAEGDSFARKVELEARLSETEDELARATRTAHAMRLLRTRVAAARETLLADVGWELEAALREALDRLGWPHQGRIELGPNLAPRGLWPPERGMENERIDLAALSAGEAEQLDFALRLVLAERFAADERQLLLLDDPLTASDATRMARALDLLREASEKLQILVLTCHPERYASLADARWLDLATLGATAEAS